MQVSNILRGAFAAASLMLASCGGGGSGEPAPGPTIFTLLVATQPAGATAASTFATQPVVQVRGVSSIATSDNTTVIVASIAPGTGAPGATLTGTTSVTVVAGVATFTNLAISTAGTGYQLQFSSAGIIGVSSGSFSVAAAPAPAVQVNFAIDSSQDVRPISRFIYGMNGWDPASRPANLTLSRSGGNRMTAYNWETNASNAGADYLNQNDDFLGGGNTPNGAVAPSIASARAAGAGIVVTLPTIGYVAADKNGGGDVNQTANYLAVRFRQSLPRKGSAFSMAPDIADAFVYQDEYVNFLDQAYAGAFASTTNPIFLSLDNEPDLWHATHARLRGDAVNPPATQHGTNVSYAEIVQRTRDYANAAKDVNPAVTIFGPVNYGWQGYIRLQDAADANNRDFLDFFLQQMAAAQVSDGRRVLDVLDVHWYPEARGPCVNPDPNDTPASCRVTTDVVQAGTVAARKQAPRSLWDPAYTETSWITQFSTNGPIRLIPRLRDKIAANYPGTRLAITEYNYGGANDISGAIAQADVLGIFGREGLFAAHLWRLSNNNNFLYGAFEMFRNYDGANGSFGDTSIRATSSDVVAASVYASVDAGNPGRMVVVAINKNDGALTAGIAVTHGTQFHTARVYRLTSAGSQPQRQADIAITQPNSFQYTMPANSVTTLVLLP
jgi:hypothetical protein